MPIGHELGLAISRATIGNGGHLFWQFSLMSSAIISLISTSKRPKRPQIPRRVELQSLLRSLPEAVVLVDCEAKIIDLNQAAEQLAGGSRGELLGRSAQVLTRDATDDGGGDNPEETVIARALRGEQVRHERRSLRTSSANDAKELLISGSPMHDLAGRQIGALLVLQDVTELSTLKRLAANSERHLAVGQMTAGLAHDFNNVLNSISDAIYVLDLQKDRTEHDRSMLNVINNAVRRGSEIVGNIREYLRGNRDMRKRVNPCQVLSEALQLAEPLLKTRPGINVVRTFQEVPVVEAVPAELRRVFNNLVLNALDAMPDAGTLTLHCYRNEDHVVASISDTGFGIPVEEQKMIFSPYFTTKPKGTGLGLAGARSAVKAMGGEIRFESLPGAGTTFYVLLPVSTDGTNQRLSQRVA